MSNGHVASAVKVIRTAQQRVGTEVIQAAKGKDFRKPLRPKAPGLGGIGQEIMAKRRNVKAIHHVAVVQGRAADVQFYIERVWREIEAIPEPGRTINLFYLRVIADATVAAALAVRDMRRGVNRKTDWE